MNQKVICGESNFSLSNGNSLLFIHRGGVCAGAMCLGMERDASDRGECWNGLEVISDKTDSDDSSDTLQSSWWSSLYGLVCTNFYWAAQPQTKAEPVFFFAASLSDRRNCYRHGLHRLHAACNRLDSYVYYIISLHIQLD